MTQEQELRYAALFLALKMPTSQTMGGYGQMGGQGPVTTYLSPAQIVANADTFLPYLRGPKLGKAPALAKKK